jgi:hypothetical protein
VTLVVAVFALVVALAGVVVAAIALGRSDRAATLAAETANQAPTPAATTEQPTTVPTGQPATDTPTDPTETSAPDDISPTAQFEVAYEGEKLRVRSPTCRPYTAGITYVDLDDPPRVGVGANGSEFSYEKCNPGKIGIGLPFAQVTGPDATPTDCLESIRTDPGHSPLAPTSGMTFCIVTSQGAAAAAGQTQKLIFVTVDAVTVDNETGVLNVTAKAWNVPQ